HRLAESYDKELVEKLIPDFTGWVTGEKAKDLAAFSNDQLIELWHERERRVMDEFAPQSLLPSLISGAALAELKSFLEECFWDDDPDSLTHLLSSGHDPDLTLRANAQLYEVAVGDESVESWLKEYGHRAPEEFDLATRRWRERPDELLQMAQRLKDGRNPAELHEHHRAECERKLAELRERLPLEDRETLDQKLALARRYMPFRENGKYYLMLGYELLRDLAMEMGRRLEIGDDVFLLTLEEMFDALNIGFAPTHLLAQRKIQRRAAKRIPLPYVIDSTNIDDLGAPPKASVEGGTLQAFGISPGGATGPARIVRSPAEAGDLGQRYILVCPSTDPSWTPLFTNAAGLILECGGTLSHGAVVAREMSIPAVVLRDACTLLRDGDSVTVDGRNGLVSRAGEEKQVLDYRTPTTDNRAEPAAADPNDTRIERTVIPPRPGRGERRSAKIRNAFLLLWGVYLLLVFCLPEQVLFQPSLRVLDFFLWPLVRLFGKPGAVAIIAGALGALTMIGQKLLTDNDRLLAAKRRAALLNQEAAGLPKDSPRGQALRRLAAPVQTRTVLASFVPLAVLLGPLVMTFMWFEPRVAIPAWNAPAGTPVTIVAMVKPDVVHSVNLSVPQPLALAQPGTQSVPEIRRVLEKYRDARLKPSDLSNQPWEVRESAEMYRQQKLADLNDYLKNLPPVPVTWNVTVPDKAAGHWPIALKADNAKILTGDIVLGDVHPPMPAEVTNTPNDPLASLKVVYQPTQTTHQVFFAPIGHWDWGWLGVYLLAYLPVMFGLRFALKIA
ncbi:MAG TPA: PEP-utilizing enzyme, partial [Tepidisphaeraceae bacterium]